MDTLLFAARTVHLRELPADEVLGQASASGGIRAALLRMERAQGAGHGQKSCYHQVDVFAEEFDGIAHGRAPL